MSLSIQLTHIRTRREVNLPTSTGYNHRQLNISALRGKRAQDYPPHPETRELQPGIRNLLSGRIRRRSRGLQAGGACGRKKSSLVFRISRYGVDASAAAAVPAFLNAPTADILSRAGDTIGRE